MQPMLVRFIPTRLQQLWCPGCFSFYKVVARVHHFSMRPEEQLIKVTVGGRVAVGEREHSCVHEMRILYLPQA